MMENTFATFQQNGFIIVNNIINQNNVEFLNAKIKALIDDKISVSKKILYTHGESPENLPSMDTILTQWLNPCKKGYHYSTAEVIHEIRYWVNSQTNNEQLLFQEYLFNKKNGQKNFHWHQDYPH